MATWKKVITEDTLENLGTSNLVMPSSELHRTYTIGAQSGTNTSQTLKFMNDNALAFFGGEMFSLIGGGFSQVTFAAEFTVFNSLGTVDMNAPGLIITSNAVGATAGPHLTLTRDNGDYALDNDLIGEINFKGLAASGAQGNQNTYASIGTKIVSGNSPLSAAMSINLMSNGNETSAVEILPLLGDGGGANILSSLVLYSRSLLALIDGVVSSHTSYAYKMVAASADNNGLGINTAVLFRFNPMQPSNDIFQIGNTSYDIGTSDLAAFLNGSGTISGTSQNGLYSQDGGENGSGIGDAWFTHERAEGAPAQLVSITGTIWWKPKRDTATSNPQIQIFLGSTSVTGADVLDATVEFELEGIDAAYTLSSDNKLDKINVSFQKSLPANASGNAITDLFILGVKYLGGSGGGSGLGNIDPAVASIYDGFVADIKVAAKPVYS